MTVTAAPESDAELISRTASGDSSAFAELWSRHASAARHAARRVTTSFDPDDLVQEAFARTLSALQAGHGPKDAFRPYVYAAIRNIAATWARRVPASEPIDDRAPMDELTLGDPAETTLEHSLIVRAFRSLPDEWRAVLWYVDVEGLSATEIAPMLGLTPNGVASLTYRAREGLRRAWITTHLNSAAMNEDCRWAAERFAPYLRRGLSTTQRQRLESHLDRCARCTVLLEELDDVARRLKVFLVPLVLGIPVLWPHPAPAAFAATAPVAPEPPVFASEPSGVSAGAKAGRDTVPTSGSVWVLALGLAAVIGLGVAGYAALAGLDGRADGRPPAEASVELRRPAQPQGTQQRPEASAEPDLAQPAVEPARMSPTDEPEVAQLSVGSDAMAVDDAVTPSSGDQLEPMQDDAAPVVGGDEEPPGPPTVEPSPPPSNPTDEEVSPAPTPTSTPTPTPDPTPSPPAVVRVAGTPFFLPEITGRALPDTMVEVVDVDTDETIARTQADSTGAFIVTATLDAGRSTVLALRQIVVSGAASELGEPLEPILLLAPRLQVEIPPAGPVRGTVLLDGEPGMVAEALIDGEPTGTLHVLKERPLRRTLPELEPGPHTLAVRYRDPTDGRVGAIFSVVVHVPDTVAGRSPAVEP